MKAAQIYGYGGPEIIKINTVGKPAPGPNQVSVEVYAGSINPFDKSIREGYMQKKLKLNFPLTIGGDFAGIVNGVGAEVSDYKILDEIYGTAITLTGATGAFAELAVVNLGTIAKMPNNVDFSEAASMPLVGSSTVMAIEEHIKLQPGQKILIHGGAGGIGSLAIQLSKSIGAYIATTISVKDFDYVKSLGADKALDYKSEKFENVLKGYDAVYDTVGGETVIRSFPVLKKGGVMVSMKGAPDAGLAKKYGVTVVGQQSKTDDAHLNRLRELVEAGKIKPQVDRVFPLEKIVEAFQYKERSHPRGKVVIKIK